MEHSMGDAAIVPVEKDGNEPPTDRQSPPEEGNKTDIPGDEVARPVDTTEEMQKPATPENEKKVDAHNPQRSHMTEEEFP
jgi:hypothetical protein